MSVAVELTPAEVAEKAAVAAMKNAQSNMDRVLKRVSSLESELRMAQATLKNVSGYVGEHSHTWPTSGANARKVRDVIAEAVARAEAVLS